VTKNAPIKFPITCEPIKKHQKQLINSPLFELLAHSDMYFPWATHKILAPKPQIAAPTNVRPYATLCRSCNDLLFGFYYISSGKIVAPTYAA